MNPEQIKMKLRGGFKPFVLHLSDGRQLRIAHPEFIMVGRGVVVVLRDDDLVETVDALHVDTMKRKFGALMLWDSDGWSESAQPMKANRAVKNGTRSKILAARAESLEPVVGFGRFKAQFRDKITHISSVIKRDLPLLAPAPPCSFADVFADSLIRRRGGDGLCSPHRSARRLAGF